MVGGARDNSKRKRGGRGVQKSANMLFIRAELPREDVKQVCLLQWRILQVQNNLGVEQILRKALAVDGRVVTLGDSSKRRECLLGNTKDQPLVPAQLRVRWRLVSTLKTNKKTSTGSFICPQLFVHTHLCRLSHVSICTTIMRLQRMTGGSALQARYSPTHCFK